MAGTLTWAASGAGVVGGAAAAVTIRPALVIPVLVLVIPLATLPLLITTLALVAVYSPTAGRRDAAEKILNQLLTVLRNGKQGAANDRSAVTWPSPTGLRYSWRHSGGRMPEPGGEEAPDEAARRHSPSRDRTRRRRTARRAHRRGMRVRGR